MFFETHSLMGHLKMILFVGLITCTTAMNTQAQQTIPCTSDTNFRTLDFLIGSWTVKSTDGSRDIATSTFKKEAKGCAITEHWEGINGFQGYSLFYYSPMKSNWFQVWITEAPRARGGLKEKEMDMYPPLNSVVFKTTYYTNNGTQVLEKTTYTRTSSATILHQIEVSTNGGSDWSVSFDAEYHRKRSL